MSIHPFLLRLPLLLGVALLSLLPGLLPAQAQAQNLVLQQALVAEGSETQFPEQAALSLQALPHDWHQSRQEAPSQYAQHPLWYRMAFDLLTAQDSRPMAVYIAQACSNVRVRFNGISLLAQGRMMDPITDHCYEPLLVPLPPELLRPQGNLLDVQLAGYARQQLNSSQRSARLSEIEIGPLEQLAQRHTRASFWRQGLPKALNAMLVMMAVTTGVLAILYRRERHLLFLSGLMLVWVLLSTRFWIGSLPLQRHWLEIGLSTCLPLITLFALQFLLREMGWRNARLNAALLAQCALVPLSLAAVGPTLHFIVASLWTALLAAELTAGMGFHLWLRWKAVQARPLDSSVQRRDFAVVCTLLALAIAAVLLELLLSQLQAPLIVPMTPLAVPLLMMGLGLHATVCVARARKVAEHKHVQLEQRMAEKLAEIERSYALMAEQKLEQVTERERKRIAADLHDDLGAKLLTIVHTSESDRISTLAREALEEMRLSVRGLTGKPVHLLDALGDWRAELVSRLGQANINAEWKSPAEDVEHTLPARAYVQTTRILRESVSNIIKHSGATHCTVSCNVQGGDFQVIIQDNGQGIPMELDGRLDKGHGMASMKARAKQMQGQCLVESGAGLGTIIRLTIPL
ncbi:sensor histidine kinase [Mitsuaria sp. WAJ17]|uniref:sensor histidine kinase n=1 Tax=Mitsuaria sp. WAJ17 TaxID=2761452 RepID=UPI001603BBF6|nr:ATP-binding protein [Mitsuaria sp. WAJ17]MBB2486693.1 sensor histidine kinase [Mitsuaria sp. WAJ17]